MNPARGAREAARTPSGVRAFASPRRGRRHPTLALAAATLLLSLSLAVPAAAQQLRGQVTDATTGQPVADAHVVLTGGAFDDVTTLSNRSGHFGLNAPAPGVYELRVRRLGYAEAVIELILGRAEGVRVEVRLSEAPIAISPISVVARRAPTQRLEDFYSRADENRMARRGRIVTREELATQPPSHLRQLWATTPRLSTCPPRFFVDGLLVEDARNVDALATPEEVEGVEIYWDIMHVPLQYQVRGSTCGVVLIWRRPYGTGGNPPSRARLVGFALFGALILWAVQ
jgi:hypothetical protein